MPPVSLSYGAPGSSLTVGNGSTAGSLAGLSSNVNPALTGGNYSIAPTEGVPKATASSLGSTGLTGNSAAASVLVPSASNIAYFGPYAPTPTGVQAAALAKLPPVTDSQGNQAVFGSNNTAAATGNGTGSLSDYLSSPAQTSTGGYAATDTTGTATTIPNFSVDTSAASTDALADVPTADEIQQQQSQYQQYLDQLAQASQYSPAYMQAYNAYQSDVANSAQLANQINNPEAPGATMGQLQTTISRNQVANSAQEAADSVALQGQELARQGDIAAATALAQGTNPATEDITVAPGSSVISSLDNQEQYSGLGGLTGVNAVDQYNSLQMEYPNANIPPYNSNLSPEENQQIAQNLVANSPAYQSQFLSSYTTAGGGTGLFSKLNLTGLQQNSDGTYSLVPAAAAALGSANANIINTQLGNLSTINVAVQSSSETLSTTQQFMQQYGLNDSSAPILNQITQGIKNQTTQQGAVTALNNDLTALRSDYSQYLVARGGSVAGSGPDSPEVLNAIPDTVSLSQLQQIVGQMQTVGTNTASAVNTQIQTALSSLMSGNTQTQTQAPAASGSASAEWASLLQ